MMMMIMMMYKGVALTKFFRDLTSPHTTPLGHHHGPVYALYPQRSTQKNFTSHCRPKNVTPDTTASPSTGQQGHDHA